MFKHIFCIIKKDGVVVSFEIFVNLLKDVVEQNTDDKYKINILLGGRQKYQNAAFNNDFDYRLNDSKMLLSSVTMVLSYNYNGIEYNIGKMKSIKKIYFSS